MLRSPASGKHPAFSGVRGLFGAGSPPDVSGFVISIIIDSVDRMLRGRTGAEIFIERRERTLPPLAYRDAPASVARIRPDFRIGAAVLHPGPDPMFRGSIHSVRHGNPASVSVQASAGPLVSVAERVRRNINDCSAITSASPDALGVTPRVQQFQHDQPSISRTRRYLNGLRFSSTLPLSASTRLSSAIEQAVRQDFFSRPAIASAAEIMIVPGAPVGMPSHDKASKSLSNLGIAPKLSRHV